MYRKLPEKLTNRDVVGKPDTPGIVYKIKVQADNTYKLEVHPAAYLTRKYTADELRTYGFELVAK